MNLTSEGLILRVAVFSESSTTFDGHGVHTAFLECKDLLGQTAGVRLVTPWELGSSDILHVHSAGPAALAMLLIHSGPKVVSAHLTADSFLGSIEYASHLTSAIASYLRFFYQKADLVIAVSPSMKNYLQQQLHITRPVEVWPNTIDSHVISDIRDRREEVRAHFNYSSERPVVLGVGQIQPRKGVDDFVAVARAMPCSDFVWVGGFLFGPLSADRRRLEEVIGSAPKNLLFTGKLDRISVYEHYVASDVFLHPSYQETFGLAILEAAAAGLPLVLRDLPSYRSIFGDSYIAVEDNDFTSAVSNVVTNHTLLNLYRKKALSVAETYNSKNYTTNLIDMYRLAKQVCRH
jgi:1,2-diacylglycerol-3-alpha-glucose alpha-1,2-galactosyltransferase